MLEFFQKARTGGREITTQDAVSPIEGIRMDDDLREKAVDIGRLVRHEESQEFLEVLKHHWQAVMLYDATRLVRGKGVATTLEMHVRKRRLFVRPDSRSMPRSLRVVDHTNHQQPLYHTRTEPENKGKLNADSFVKLINLTKSQDWETD